MLFESVEIFEEGINPQGCEEERYGQPERIDHKKQNTQPKGFGGACYEKYGSEYGANARCPARRKSESHEK